MIQETITLDDYAKTHNLDPQKLKRTLKRLGRLPEPALTGRAGQLYYTAELDRARGYAPGWVTLAEYAQKHGLSPETLGTTWPRRLSDVWPEPVASRQPAQAGRWPDVYEEADLDRMRRLAWNLPEPEGSPDDLLTWEQMCAYLGVSEERMRARVWERRWPPGEVGDDGVERWRRGDVEAQQARLMRRQR